MDESVGITPEQMEDAKVEAIHAIAMQNAEMIKKQPWYLKAAKWFYTSIISPICRIVFSGVKETVAFIINNPENQNLAKIAIIAAAKAGFKGNAAWAAAMTVFKAGSICIAVGKYIKCSELDTNIRETILQLVYTCLKNSAEGKKLLECTAKGTPAVFPELPCTK